jgi:CHRD domain
MTRRPSGTARSRFLLSVAATAGLVVSLVLPASATSTTDVERNGGSVGRGAAAAEQPLMVNSGWQEVLFGAVGSTLTLDLSAPTETWLRLTDMFCAGDEFRVLDNGMPLQPTAPATASTCGAFTSSPTRAELGDAWSSGGWLLAAGRHTITVSPSRSPFGGGSAFVRADVPAMATAHLRGSSEVPGPGDPDGQAVATTVFLGRSGQVCYAIAASGLDDVLAGHIHRGGPTVAGPIVVNLQLPPGSQPFFISCVPADRAVLAEIAFAPWSFYLNLHTSTFPDGAIRGQLQPPRTP